MKKLLTLTTLVFTVLFSSTSFAEWTEVVKDVDGNTYYVDYERIKKHDGYVYFWYLSDLLKPDSKGDLSYKSYNQGDCNLFRYKIVSDFFYKESMGQGTPVSNNVPDKNWRYPPPGSSMETILKRVCSFVKRNSRRI